MQPLDVETNDERQAIKDKKHYQNLTYVLTAVSVLMAVILGVFIYREYAKPSGSSEGASPAPGPPTNEFFLDSHDSDTYSKCTEIVKKTLTGHKDDLSSDINARIGQMLGAQFSWTDTSGDFAASCCAAGTEYDHFIMNNAPFATESDYRIDNRTLLIVVDMQRDFTVGSFGQPCWTTGGDHLSADIATLMKQMASKGATIAASKDFHPSDHCSFRGNCRNTKDYKHLNFTADQRYINYFPSHCTWTDVDGNAVPQQAPSTPFCSGLPDAAKPPFCKDDTFIGAGFDSAIGSALWEIMQTSPDNAEVVFKGINQRYDSFAVIPHMASSGEPVTAEETKFTGGWALLRDRKTACMQAGSFDSQTCYPTTAELRSPESEMRDFRDIVRERNINKIISVGLVYDFCVKETTIFAKEWDAMDDAVSFESFLVADLARPSFDGKPGAPWFPASCDGGKAEDQYCSIGGGTTRNHAAVLEDLLDNNVKVLRFLKKLHESSATSEDVLIAA